MTRSSIRTLLLGASGLLLLAGCRMHGFGFRGFGLIGLILLVFQGLATLEIIGTSWETTRKVLWIAVIFFLPIIGLLAYYFAGRDKRY